MGVFSDRTSMDRILFAVFNHENRNQGLSTPRLLTQTLLTAPPADRRSTGIVPVHRAS
jgi:hypothetical protein